MECTPRMVARAQKLSEPRPAGKLRERMRDQVILVVLVEALIDRNDHRVPTCAFDAGGSGLPLSLQRSGYEGLRRRDAGAEPRADVPRLRLAPRRQAVVVVLQQRRLTVADEKDARHRSDSFVDADARIAAGG